MDLVLSCRTPQNILLAHTLLHWQRHSSRAEFKSQVPTHAETRDLLLQSGGNSAWPRTCLSVRCSNLKMCTVSVLLEAHRNCESILNTRELIVTYLETATHRSTSRNSEGHHPTVLRGRCVSKGQAVLTSPPPNSMLSMF